MELQGPIHSSLRVLVPVPPFVSPFIAITNEFADHHGRQRLPGSNPWRPVPLRRRVAIRERGQTAVGPVHNAGRSSGRLPQKSLNIDQTPHTDGHAAARRRAGALFIAAVRPQRRGGVAQAQNESDPAFGGDAVVRGGV